MYICINKQKISTSYMYKSKVQKLTDIETMYRETVSLSIVPANVTIPVVVPILNKLEAKEK